MGELKTEADWDPEELNRKPSGGRKRGKWAGRFGLSDPIARSQQLDEQDNGRANEVLRQYALEIDVPKLVRKDTLPADAAENAEESILESREIQKKYQKLPSVIATGEK